MWLILTLKSMPRQEYLRRMVEKQAARNPLSYKPTDVTLQFLMHFRLLNTVIEGSILEGKKSDLAWQKEIS